MHNVCNRKCKLISCEEHKQQNREILPCHLEYPLIGRAEEQPSQKNCKEKANNPTSTINNPIAFLLFTIFFLFFPLAFSIFSSLYCFILRFSCFKLVENREASKNICFSSASTSISRGTDKVKCNSKRKNEKNLRNKNSEMPSKITKGRTSEKKKNE